MAFFLTLVQHLESPPQLTSTAPRTACSPCPSRPRCSSPSARTTPGSRSTADTTTGGWDKTRFREITGPRTHRQQLGSPLQLLHTLLTKPLQLQVLYHLQSSDPHPNALKSVSP